MQEPEDLPLRRRRQPENWAVSKRRKIVLEGKERVTPKKKQSRQKIGAPCTTCEFHCFQNLTHGDREHLFAEFGKRSKPERIQYLAIWFIGLAAPTAVTQPRTSTS